MIQHIWHCSKCFTYTNSFNPMLLKNKNKSWFLRQKFELSRRHTYMAYLILQGIREIKHSIPISATCSISISSVCIKCTQFVHRQACSLKSRMTVPPKMAGRKRSRVSGKMHWVPQLLIASVQGHCGITDQTITVWPQQYVSYVWVRCSDSWLQCKEIREQSSREQTALLRASPYTPEQDAWMPASGGRKQFPWPCLTDFPGDVSVHSKLFSAPNKRVWTPQLQPKEAAFWTESYKTDQFYLYLVPSLAFECLPNP